MKTILFLLTSIVCFSFGADAQSYQMNFRQDSLMFQKSIIMVDMVRINPGNRKEFQRAHQSYIREKYDVSPSLDKEFIVYKGVKLGEGSASGDLYFKVIDLEGKLDLLSFFRIGDKLILNAKDHAEDYQLYKKDMEMSIRLYFKGDLEDKIKKLEGNISDQQKKKEKAKNGLEKAEGEYKSLEKKEAKQASVLKKIEKKLAKATEKDAENWKLKVLDEKRKIELIRKDMDYQKGITKVKREEMQRLAEEVSRLQSDLNRFSSMLNNIHQELGMELPD